DADQQIVIVDLDPLLSARRALQPVAIIVADMLLALPLRHALAARPMMALECRTLRFMSPWSLVAGLCRRRAKFRLRWLLVVLAWALAVISGLGLCHRRCKNGEGDRRQY